MPLDILIGAQWGDEGKGRLTDLLAEQAAVVARYSGGDNAGHTITIQRPAGQQILKLHLLPSGVAHPATHAVLGSGMVINPARLIHELDTLSALGLDVSPARVKIASNAHLITPAHVALDRAEEQARAQKTGGQIGTTGRGIGPAYTSKTARHGLRADLLRDPEALAEALVEHIAQANQSLIHLYGAPPLDPAQAAAEYAAHAPRLSPYLTDTGLYLHQQLLAGHTVLAEGAQGSLLDLDHGTYPFVTSSSPTAGGALVGLGVGPRWVRRVIGVTKAFQTRVGAGPFPTEAFGAVAERLRGTGANPWDEFGTTTGRPRRCGWLDVVLLRYAIRINGLTELALTKLDILTGLDTIRVGVAYRTASGQTHPELPNGPADLSPFTAEYEDLPGWSAEVSAARHWHDLPANAQNYVRRLEALTGLPITLISVGPERSQIIRRD